MSTKRLNIDILSFIIQAFLCYLSSKLSYAADLPLGPDKQCLSVQMLLFPYLSIETCVLSAQKNCLIKMYLLRTHSICLG